MNKRIIIKTTLICIGIFLILSSAGIYFFSTKYELDKEEKHQVVIAAADISVGSIITENMVTEKTIKESGLTPHMLQNSEQVVGMKVLSPILKGDYIPQYNLLPSDKWHKDDDRTIILTVDMEERLANLIKKGSVIDIKVLPEERKALPKLVLSRIMVSDVLDENGLSSGDAIGNRKGYIVVVLDNQQRNRIYAAIQYGKLMYELYCDLTQPKEIEDFVITKEFYAPDQQSGSIKDGGAN
jgi:Flp pilus assembly protein CpaB